jgi:hypothetical protein
MFTISVYSSSTGKPLSGKRVSVQSAGLLGGSLGSDQRTNSQGEVHIDHEPVNGTVYVEGRKEHQGRLQGNVKVYV